MCYSDYVHLVLLYVLVVRAGFEPDNATFVNLLNKFHNSDNSCYGILASTTIPPPDYFILIDIKPAPNIIAISSTVCIGKKVNNKALHTVKH
jgi:hypothetical protein